MAINNIFRGDSDSFTMSVPLTLWSAGGKFFFALKSKGLINESDITDTNAVLKKTYDDTYITSTTATDKVYTLTLTHADTLITPGKYVGEFQWVNAAALVDPTASTAQVKTFTQFKYKIDGDVNQRVA